ncbi:IS630 family transposase [Streptomyces sp. NRRL F-525]|uniref:IS630 family transposase n=1 Tax=Streptomyces sp. NRRL F-525 TaxID=1463861 RepID=UPI000B2FAE0B|nr:IS630 family transposase [Streptomyces sp. NRRL F-525]
MGTYLCRWGLTFQRPDERAVEQNAEAVHVRYQETWPAIRAKARAEGSEVLFADQAGIRSDEVTSRTWGEKRRTPTVRRTGNRFSVNAMSAISTKGRGHFMVFTETIDADVMCRFLDRLAGHVEHKAHLVLDSHCAHRSRKARAWPAAHPDRIELHFLPSYSPEPNPDELVNADLERSLPMHHRARDQAQLAAETRRFFPRRQRQPHIVRGCIGGPHVLYTLEQNPLSSGSVGVRSGSPSEVRFSTRGAGRPLPSPRLNTSREKGDRCSRIHGHVSTTGPLNGTEHDKPHAAYHAVPDDAGRAGTAVRHSTCLAHETAERRNAMEKTVVTSDPQSDERESVKVEVGITVKF